MQATTTTKITKGIILAAAGVGLTVALTGCSGGSALDGTYYVEEVNGTSDLG